MMKDSPDEAKRTAFENRVGRRKSNSKSIAPCCDGVTDNPAREKKGHPDATNRLVIPDPRHGSIERGLCLNGAHSGATPRPLDQAYAARCRHSRALLHSQA